MKNKHTAFTLIEMLLGLSLFSIVALSLYSVFASGIQIEKRAQTDGMMYRETRWALDKMESDLENMVQYNFANSYPQKLAFIGESNRISFIVPTDEGLKRVSYYLETPQSGSIHMVLVGKHHKRNVSVATRLEESQQLYVLMRDEKPFAESLQEGISESGQADALILRIIESGLRFYYGYVEGEDESARLVWRDYWTGEYLPSGIKVQLTMGPSGYQTENVTIERGFFIPTGFLGQ